MTMKIKRYFRGSGRVLAFVFIASVIWLLFDMAALRFSINDVNSQLLKQSVIKERELFRQQTTKVTQIIKGGFKYPVQRIDTAGGKPVNLGNKVAEIYRQKSKKREEIRSDNKKEMVLEQMKAKTRSSKSFPKQDKEVVPADNMPKPDLPVLTKPPAKKAVNFDQSETNAEVNKDGINESVKMTLLVLPNDANVPPGVQGGKHTPLPISVKKVHNIAYTVQSKTYEDKDKHSRKSGIKVNQIKEDEPHSFNSSLPNDAKTKTFVIKGEKEQDPVTVRNDLYAAEEPLQPNIKPKLKREADIKANSTVVRNPGVHKVLSLDMTDAPRDANAVGQFGHAAVVSNEMQGEMKKRWDEGHFNVYLSDKIPVDRAIPDTRPQTCAESVVHNDLPTTSVIFCFVDEVWSTLLRSVHSVFNRSPPHLLAEIILVDDFSTKDYLKEQLDVYMAQFPKVRIVRLKERQGLIRARLAGAAVAKGEVLTFLDSHVECNVGWLEPLLERVYLDRKKVACPVIEVINDKDMSYVMVDNFQRGIFKWPLVFGWSTLTGEYIKKNNMTVSDPIRCPVMAGGLFSIDKKYFYELGTYDSGLDVWGGENMEISFKIWMCGGEIEIIPCSRVGHIFRGKNPYTFPKDRQKTVERNLARVAEVWLDEYKDIFYGHGYHHLLDRTVVDIGNLTEQIELRKSLHCKSFKWYLENIYPDMDAPLVKAEGLVFNRGLRKCLALQNRSLSFEICDLSKKSQHFNYTWLRHIQQKDLCVVPQGTDTDLVLQLCDRAKPSHRWFHKASNSALIAMELFGLGETELLFSPIVAPPFYFNVNLTKYMGEHLLAESSPYNMCLEGGLQGISVHLSECEPNNAFQKWQFTHYYAK